MCGKSHVHLLYGFYYFSFKIAFILITLFIWGFTHVLWHACDQRTACWSQFCISTLYCLEVEVLSSDSVAGVLTSSVVSKFQSCKRRADQFSEWFPSGISTCFANIENRFWASRMSRWHLSMCLSFTFSELTRSM